MAVSLSLGTQRGLGAPHPVTTFCLGPIVSVIEAQGISSGRGRGWRCKSLFDGRRAGQVIVRLQVNGSNHHNCRLAVHFIGKSQQVLDAGELAGQALRPGQCGQQ